MHILIIYILFAIPSLLLAEKCPHQFKSPRTKRIETTWICCPGYRTGSGGNCSPICTISCGWKGVCNGPNKCQCDKGYQYMDKDISKGCVPVCDNCENGYCVAPTVCTKCSEGYTIMNNACYSGEANSEMQTTHKFFNAWTVGILIIVILAIVAFVIYRVLYYRNNTKNTSPEGCENHIMVTKE